MPDEVTRSEAVLARYRRRIRRQRGVYLGAVAIVVAVVASLVGVVWSGGEIAHTTLHTATRAAPSIALEAPASSPQRQWHTGERTAIGTTPYWGGTVVTHSRDSVRGRDARTGTITWSYTRSDRSVCTAIQVAGITLAIFRLHGNCDQVTALDTGTGQRKWTRTMDENGNPLDGPVHYAISDDTVLMRTTSVIYAIDPTSGIDRWIFNQGCRITGAALGSEGVLISQDCRHPDCGDRKFCGAGPQLLLRDRTEGAEEDAKDHNPDKIKWNRIGDTGLPVSADQVICSVDPAGGVLTTHDADKGTPVARVRLQPAPASVTRPVTTQTSGAELIWMGGVYYALDPHGTALRWALRTPAAPTVTAAEPGELPDLASARITVADSSGIAQLDGTNGALQQRFTRAAAPAGSRAYAFGTGFLLAGASTTMYQ